MGEMLECWFSPITPPIVTLVLFHCSRQRNGEQSTHNFIFIIVP